ncbi:HAD family hydrolase [Sphingobacterium lumbrici]|uniref:HAD family hydrolase n=1 Tax=Sphingobacterium lumbrici TaxID=2559600 RepID=UPI00112972A4|nr:HAD family hydrolase [Sphingobacterium lumbrici]
MNIEDIPLDKEVYLFEVDDVLFAKSDYDLQVYYLFANFMEFTTGFLSAKDLVDFMKKVYENQGEEFVFEGLKEAFGIDEKYKENLLRLNVNAQLPLKLVLFKEVEELIVRLFTQNKQVAILTKGNPVEQLNKLKHIDWGEANRFKSFLKVYFVDELKFRFLEPIDYIAEDYGVRSVDLYCINAD